MEANTAEATEDHLARLGSAWIAAFSAADPDYDASGYAVADFEKVLADAGGPDLWFVREPDLAQVPSEPDEVAALHVPDDLGDLRRFGDDAARSCGVNPKGASEHSFRGWVVPDTETPRRGPST